MIAIVSFGSNLGDREANIDQAVCAIRALPSVQSVRCAPLYETDPVGPPQPPYLNSAATVTLSVDMEPRALVRDLLSIESAMGRQRVDGERNAPRKIDIDVLWIEGKTSDFPDAIVPHPRLTERPFALVPLLDLAPDCHDPQGVPYREHLARIGRVGIRRVWAHREPPTGR